MDRVVCGKCGADPEIVSDANGEEDLVCPDCGQKDKIEDARRIVLEHVADQAKALLNEKMREVSRTSKIIKGESEFTTGGDFRWKAAE